MNLCSSQVCPKAKPNQSGREHYCYIVRLSVQTQSAVQLLQLHLTRQPSPPQRGSKFSKYRACGSLRSSSRQQPNLHLFIQWQRCLSPPWPFAKTRESGSLTKKGRCIKDSSTKVSLELRTPYSSKRFLTVSLTGFYYGAIGNPQL